eukprot:564662-Rhodomonas_salina.3
MSLGLAEPICHYPEPVLLSQIGEAACFCRQDRSDDDASWIIQNAFTVLSMQAGFALLEAGSVTDLNVVNIMVLPVLLRTCRSLGLGVRCTFYLDMRSSTEEKRKITQHLWVINSDPGQRCQNLTAMPPWCAAGAGNYALVGLTDHTNFLFSFSFAMSTATIISGAVLDMGPQRMAQSAGSVRASVLFPLTSCSLDQLASQG